MPAATQPDQPAARFAMADCLHLYCHAIDRRDWRLMERVFFADARYRLFAKDYSRAEIVVAIRGLIEPTVQTQHQVSNFLPRFIDGGTAISETYFHAYHAIPADYPDDNFLAVDGGGVILIGGRYVDRFECRHGNWQIARRHVLVDWTRRLVGSDAGLGGFEAAWCGLPGARDPSIAVVDCALGQARSAAWLLPQE